MPASRPKKPGDPLHPRATGPLRSFGRIKSRVIKPLQAALFDTLLPGIAVPDPKAGPIDPLALMPEATEVWLEIGFGGGEHLAAQAARHPDALMIGCEPFLNGVASMLRHIDEGGLKNVRLHADDGRDVLNALPDASLDRVMILFPDPWHKVRHNKRRLLNEETATQIARVLKPGGRLRFVTDWKDYAEWSLERLTRTPGLAWTANAADDWRIAPADHVVTRYEEKKLGDTPPLFLEFVREASQKTVSFQKGLNMAFGIYEASAPVFVRALTNLAAIIDKAVAQGFDETELMQARLAEDMRPFPAQIQLASDAAKGAVARLSGTENPSMADTEATLAELKTRIAATIAFINSVDRKAFDDAEDREIVLKIPSGEMQFNGAGYLTGFALPNFFFHVTTAYDLLRHKGVQIGKLDYLGGR